jgi:hypothetical protein
MFDNPMSTDTIFAPGSQEALEFGCTCSTISNHFGKGILCVEGVPVFVYEIGCPLHDEFLIPSFGALSPYVC